MGKLEARSPDNVKVFEQKMVGTVCVTQLQQERKGPSE